MFFPAGSSRLPSMALRLMVAVAVMVAAGCGGKPRQTVTPQVTSRYPQLKPKNLPDYLKGTVLERVDVIDTQPLPVSGYGLVANLNGTGDTRAPNAVREYMIKQMEKRGFGSQQLGYSDITPEKVLRDPRSAIVRVDGFIPPGARRGQPFDIQVSVLRDNNTTSLARGQLYRCDLKIDGANPRYPGMAVESWAFAEGDLFVNPAYALELIPATPEARNSLRSAVALGGGVVQMDRPLRLRLRQPSYAVARQIEQRLDEFLQDGSHVAALDEGIVSVRVPPKYGNDWEHFRGVITHVYFNASPTFILSKAEQLAAEAVKPDAPLEDISYCWEALGPTILPFITPLMTHQQPDIAYAAARAAAFLGDVSAQTALIEMARTADHPFQLNAVQTLAKLPQSPEIESRLRYLMRSPQNLVRLEAYRTLAAVEDPSVFARWLPKGRFWLDIIPSDGPALIYASRRERPRLAVFGRKPSIELPITFSAMEGKLSISSNPGKQTVTIFYRGPGVNRPVSVESNPDLAELAARLGGAGPADEPGINLSYCDVVAIVQALVDQKKVTQSQGPSRSDRTPVAFVLQDLPFALDPIYDAPVLPGQQQERPQTDSPGTVSSAAAGSPNDELQNPKK